MSSIKDDVIEIIAEQLGIDKKEITPEKALVEGLNADSLDLTELIMTFEERFNFEISDGEAEKLKKVSDIISFIELKLSEAHAKKE